MARMPAWLPHKQVNLGLDLQGGAHLLYQLDEKEMTGDWLATIRGDVRETLRKARVGYTDLSQNVAARQVTVKIRDAADMDKAFQELRKLAQPVGGNVFSGFSGTTWTSPGRHDVSLTSRSGLTHRMGSAIQASIETIRRRVDAVARPSPASSEGRDRVLVQVPASRTSSG
jgi:preprotein translocase subunit SecD